MIRRGDWRLIALLLCMAGWTAQGQETPCRIAFWNVENLFDTWRDTLKNDEEFTPYGSNHWTAARLHAKANQIGKTLIAIGEGTPPALVGLAEVENASVLRELCRATPLRRYGYDFVHFESPDRRGIDVALLYRVEDFTVNGARAVGVSDSAKDFFTRDLLEVRGVLTGGDSLTLYVCHFPSKRGGAVAERRRMRIARQLRSLMDSAMARCPSGIVLAMGDFNASPEEPCMAQGLGIAPKSAAGQPFVNLMGRLPAAQGSYCYQGVWSLIDQMMVSSNALEEEGDAGPGGSAALIGLDGSASKGAARSALHVEGNAGHVFSCWPLLADDPRHLNRRPCPTYQGPRYVGGASDHLPVYIILSH